METDVVAAEDDDATQQELAIGSKIEVDNDSRSLIASPR